MFKRTFGCIFGAFTALLAIGFMLGMISQCGAGNDDKNSITDKINLLEQPGDVVSTKDFQVTDVLESGYAIARELKNTKNKNWSDLKVVIYDSNNGSFYDKQIIKMPKGKCARLIGTYKYYSETLPVVQILE